MTEPDDLDLLAGLCELVDAVYRAHADCPAPVRAAYADAVAALNRWGEQVRRPAAPPI